MTPGTVRYNGELEVLRLIIQVQVHPRIGRLLFNLQQRRQHIEFAAQTVSNSATRVNKTNIGRFM